MMQKERPVPSAPSAPDMENVGEVEMQSLLSIPKTKCFTIKDEEHQQLGDGELNCCALEDDSLLLYIPNVFQYAINKDFPSLRSSKYSFVFPGTNGVCFGVVFPENTSMDDIEMFEGLLVQYSQYQIDETLQENIIKVKELKENIDEKVDEIKSEELKQDDKLKDKDIERGQKMVGYIQKGTILATKGIKKGTSLASIGIRKSNQYIKNRIKLRKNVEVSDATKTRIASAKKVSKSAVTISKAVLVGAKKMCSELSISASDAASKTKLGKQWSQSENGKIVAAKQVSKATITGGLAIIEELHNAAIILVAEVADSGANIAAYKYGEKVGDAAQGVADIVKDGTQVFVNVHDLGIKPLAASVVGKTAVDLLSTDDERKANRGNGKHDNPHVEQGDVIAAMSQIQPQQSGKKYDV